MNELMNAHTVVYCLKDVDVAGTEHCDSHFPFSATNFSPLAVQFHTISTHTTCFYCSTGSALPPCVKACHSGVEFFNVKLGGIVIFPFSDPLFYGEATLCLNKFLKYINKFMKTFKNILFLLYINLKG